jgi:hypothetical protein
MAVGQPVAPKPVDPAVPAGYSILDESEVIAFLDARPRLGPILDEAPIRVERTFGRKLPLRLRVFRDRGEPGSAELVMEIVTGEAGANAWIDADLNLRRLYEEWLAGIPREVSHDILFVTEPA